MRILLIEGGEKVSSRLSGEIVLATRLRNGQAIFEVAPNGPGIPVQARPQICDGFCRADSVRSRSVRGAGLGLFNLKQT